MRERIGLWLLVALLLTPGAFAQRTCYAETPWGKVEYSCGARETTPAEQAAEEPWWASAAAQAIMGIVGIVGSVGAGGYTYYRVRSRRLSLSATLAAIERAYLDAKTHPDAGLGELAALRADVRARHARGKMDDAHFLELDRRATQYLAKLRLLEIDRRFARLPPLLLAEVRRLLSDGVLSHSEADLVEVRAAAYRIPDDARAELVALARRWAGEDGPVGDEPAPAAADQTSPL